MSSRRAVASRVRSARRRVVLLLAVLALGIAAFAVPASAAPADAAPTVTSVAPRSLPPQGGVTVTVRGTGLGSVVSVVVGNRSAAGLTHVSSTQLTFTAPPYPDGGSLHVVVQANGGPSSTATSRDLVTYRPEFKVTGLSRSTGPAKGGTRVTVLGTGLQDVRSVHFGRRAATAVHVVSSSRVTATAPAGTGLVDVTVTTAKATSAVFDGDHYLYGGPALAQAEFPGSSIGQIDDVACPASGACVAVGRTGANGGAPGVYGQPLAFVLSGSTWRRVTVPVPAGYQYAELYSVACSSPGQCWAVGAAASGPYPQTSVNFLAHNTGDRIDVSTLPDDRSYGPLACATTPGSCLLAATKGRAAAFLPLPLGSAPEQPGTELPDAPYTGISALRCRAAGSCVAWGDAVDDHSRGTAFAEQSVDGVWRGASITPLTGDDSTDLATVVCDTARTCTGYGNSTRHGETSDKDVTRPIRVQLSADDSLHVTEVALDPRAGQAGEPVSSVACTTPVRCVGATSDPYTQANWVDRLTSTGWSSTGFFHADRGDVFRQVGATQCTATGYCFATGSRSRYGSDGNLVAAATAYVPVGAGYAQIDLPGGDHRVVSPVVSSCAPTGSFCALVLEDTISAGLGGQLTVPFAVTVRPAS